MTRFDSTNQTRTPNQTPRKPKSPASSAGSRPAPTSSRRSKARPGNAYLGLANSLGSARDRQRLRDRNAAERARVERMLASAPDPIPLISPTTPANPSNPAERTRVAPAVSMRAIQGRTCPVCASVKVVTDEVTLAGTLRLAECLHCDHRWTERPRSRWSELGASMTRGANRERRPRVAQPMSVVS